MGLKKTSQEWIVIWFHNSLCKTWNILIDIIILRTRIGSSVLTFLIKCTQLVIYHILDKRLSEFFFYIKEYIRWILFFYCVNYTSVFINLEKCCTNVLLFINFYLGDFLRIYRWGSKTKKEYKSDFCAWVSPSLELYIFNKTWQFRARKTNKLTLKVKVEMNSLFRTCKLSKLMAQFYRALSQCLCHADYAGSNPGLCSILFISRLPRTVYICSLSLNIYFSTPKQACGPCK